MADFDYFCFLRRRDNFLLFETRDLYIKKHPALSEIENYLEIFKDIDISFIKPDQKPELEAYNAVQEKNPKKLLENNNLEKNVNGQEITSVIQQIQTEMQNSELKKEKISKDIKNIEDIENLLCGVPEVIKYTHSQSKDNRPLYYNIVIGVNVAFICVSETFHENLRENLIKVIRTFEKIFSVEIINETKKKIESNEFLKAICEEYHDIILNNYLIPNLPLLNSNYKSENKEDNDIKNESFVDVSLKIQDNLRNILDNFIEKNLSKSETAEIKKKILNIPNVIDGISNIEILSEKLRFSSEELKKYILYLRLKNLISIRIPWYDWHVFERTHKANPYLYDGSVEQINFINKYGGGKIISILSKFDARRPIKEIRKKMNIMELKFIRYVYELRDNGLIQIVPFYPKLKHIGEDVIPLLVMWGLSQEDIAFIDELESEFDGLKTITEISLKYSISPEKIKIILDKIPDYVEWIKE